jgi:hypothetical protein
MATSGTKGFLLPATSGRPMKKKPSAKKPARRTKAAMRPEYDFTKGVRGKYAARLKPGSQVVVLDPDVAAAFGDARAVNRALRTLIEVMPTRQTRAGRSSAGCIILVKPQRGSSP